jgi:hypothetical protein
MTDIRAAHELLAKHAEEAGNTALANELHKLAVDSNWEEPSAADIAKNIRI